MGWGSRSRRRLVPRGGGCARPLRARIAGLPARWRSSPDPDSRPILLAAPLLRTLADMEGSIDLPGCAAVNRLHPCMHSRPAHLISRSTWRLRSSGIGLLCCRANTAGSCPGSLLGCIAFGARHYMLPRPALHSSRSISLLRKSSRRTAMSSSNGVRAPDPSPCDWSRSSLSQSTMD